MSTPPPHLKRRCDDLDLTLQGPSANEVRRKRQKVHLDDVEQAHRPAVRGCHSDDEDEDGYRAGSSHLMEASELHGHIDPTSIATTAIFSTPIPRRYSSHGRKEYVQVQRSASAERTTRYSAKAIYGDHSEYHRVQVEHSCERRSESSWGSRAREYGEHRFDEVQETEVSARVRDLVNAIQERISQGDGKSQPLTSGRTETSNANTKHPSHSNSQHPDVSPQFLSDNLNTKDLGLGEDQDTSGFESGLGASTTATRQPSSSPSSPDLGALGTKACRYEPLQASDIRLVKIWPKTMSKLKCEIIHMSLESEPEYIAISVSYHRSNQIPTLSLRSMPGVMDSIQDRLF
jgi:hypothetical protein